MLRLLPRIALLAALAGSAACIITGADTTLISGSDGTTGGSCPDPNSYWEDGICYCDEGYAFCNDNPDDLTCCSKDGTSGDPPTTSEPGTTTGDPTTAGPTGTTTGTTEPVSTTGTTGTTTGTTASTTGSSTTTGGMVCTGPRPPPDTCESGQFWCTQSEVCGPQDSELYRCEDGAWALDPNLAHDSCVIDGYDFSYGCVDDGKSVVFICGDGPGTDCEDADPATCFDDKLLSACVLGKLTHYDCFVQCTEVGDEMMVLYDHGFCGDDMGTSVCLCCDMGDPGCPI